MRKTDVNRRETLIIRSPLPKIGTSGKAPLPPLGHRGAGLSCTCIKCDGDIVCAKGNEALVVPSKPLPSHDEQGDPRAESQDAGETHPSMVPELLRTRKGRRRLTRRGGAAKMLALAPEIHALLFKPDRGNSRALRVGGLAARGMGQRRSRPIPIIGSNDFVEHEIQMILRERGLVKDA